MTATDIHSGLTVEQLRQYLDYNGKTGQLIWRVNQSGRSNFVGRAAGCLSKQSGYILVGLTVNGVRRLYRAHRLVWLHVTGAWPRDEIDHINQTRNDNRFENLRDVDRLTNAQNERRARKQSRTGLLGVTRVESGAFASHIETQGKLKYLGRFDTAELAHAAYVDAKRKLHQGCTL